MSYQNAELFTPQNHRKKNMLVGH